MDIDDLDNNEDELVDKKGNKIKKDLAEKAMIGENEEAQNILNDAREINEIKYRKNIKRYHIKKKMFI